MLVLEKPGCRDLDSKPLEGSSEKNYIYIYTTILAAQLRLCSRDYCRSRVDDVSTDDQSMFGHSPRKVANRVSLQRGQKRSLDYRIERRMAVISPLNIYVFGCLENLGLGKPLLLDEMFGCFAMAVKMSVGRAQAFENKVCH